jgi:hypothetical protein
MKRRRIHEPDGVSYGYLQEEETEELWLDGRELRAMGSGLVESFCEDTSDGYPVYMPDVVRWLEFEPDHWSALAAVAEFISATTPASDNREYLESLKSLDTRIQYQNQRDRLGGDLTVDLCAYCDLREGIVIEHMRPLSHRGRTTLTNIAPSCWSCNRDKGTKLIAEWLGDEQYRTIYARHREAVDNVLRRVRRAA